MIIKIDTSHIYFGFKYYVCQDRLITDIGLTAPLAGQWYRSHSAHITRWGWSAIALSATLCLDTSKRGRLTYVRACNGHSQHECMIVMHVHGTGTLMGAARYSFVFDLIPFLRCIVLLLVDKCLKFARPFHCGKYSITIYIRPIWRRTHIEYYSIVVKLCRSCFFIN